MTSNILKNPRFSDIGKPGRVQDNFFEICDGWVVEFNCREFPHVVPLEEASIHDGLRLVAPGAGGWIRLLQPFRFKTLEAARFSRLSVSARVGRGEPGGLTMDWAAILKTNSSGKLVFARKLLTQPANFGQEWDRVSAHESLSDLASDTPYYLALQFSNGPGALEIRSVEFSCHETAATFEGSEPAAERTAAFTAGRPASGPVEAASPTAPAAVSSVTQTPNASLVAVDKGRIVGWADLPAEERITVIVDGQVIGSTQASGLAASDHHFDPNIAGHGFALDIPEHLLDSRQHKISLQLHSNGKRVFCSPSELKFTPAKQEVTQLPSPIAPTLERAGQVGHTHSSPARSRHIAVVSWDMGHNPAGRAYLLAEMAARNPDCTVELVGPLFPAYGTRIWPPILGSGMKMQAYPAPTFREFLLGALDIAARTKCDLVHVGKARFSSLLIGALIKQANNCPMICDIDDHELGFFPNRAPASLAEFVEEIRKDPAILDKPYTEIFTRYAESLIADCDGVTVSNYALQSRFGGIVVRHGRDERLFNPESYDRRAVRAEFGYNDADRVILFLGTPRPHKGIYQIAQALDHLKDDRLALCVIGSINDKRVLSRFGQYKSARISFNPDQPWQRLPELVSMADVVFLLQDPESAISDYQMPAKLTDALALGVPVFATPVAPLRDVIAAGAIDPIETDEQLLNMLRALSAGRISAQRARDYYFSELSYGVNAARLASAFDRAVSNKRQMMPRFERLFETVQSLTGIAMPSFSGKQRAPAAGRSAKPDVVFLWKQNDSDIYGRRPDMISRYLGKSGKVGRIIHFDAPISSTDLDKQAKHGPDAVANQGNLIYLNTVRRILRQADTPSIIRRTFLHRAGKQAERYLGMDLPPRDAYPEFIKATLKQEGVSENPILYVCPVVFDFQDFRSVIQPDCVIADIIDDQRRFPAREQYKRRVIDSYNEILAGADFVFANCEPVRESFASLRGDIHVVPNGAEIFDLTKNVQVPEDIADLPHPILGYVGNLRDRVDLELIGKVADFYRQGSVVLIGSAHDRPEVLQLAQRPNVHVLGVKPYEQVTNYIRSFDVALVPHLRNDLSESMNPLKLYVYFALGVPIVTTDLANIGDIGPHESIATSHEEFITKIEDILNGRKSSPSWENRKNILDQVSWETRVKRMLEIIGY